MYRIRVSNAITPCWIDDSEGDPGRTCQQEKATIWKSEGAAKAVLQALQEDFPNREFAIEPF